MSYEASSRSQLRLVLTTAFVALNQTGVEAQSGAFEQDSTLDNLRHPAGYLTAPPGTLGEVVRRGSGPTDVLIIAGWGFGAREFDSFMRDNASRYRMVAVTLPGFAGTPAPPMPPVGTSYGDATWTRAAENAIVRIIERERLRRPIVVGHFIVGTQIALRLALDHPMLVGGVVVVGGEPMRFVPSRRDSTGKTPMPRDERVNGVDAFMAPRWFKTVTRKTWLANNYAQPQYARDSVRAGELWRASADVPLPVMIRYLCEYYATDLRDEFPHLAVETRVLVPEFSPEILADPKQAYVKALFWDSWETVRGLNPRIQIRPVAGARIFVTDDRPDVVREAIDDLARPERSVTDSVVALENARRDALLRADTVALSRMVAAEFTEISRLGRVRTRSDNMREIANGDLKLTAVKYDSLNVSRYANVAVLTGIADNVGTYRGFPFAGRVRYTRIFIGRDGRWQAVLMQHTPIQ